MALLFEALLLYNKGLCLYIIVSINFRLTKIILILE